MTIENNEAVAEEDKSTTIHYEYFRSDKAPEPKQYNKIKVPSLGELLDSKFRERKYLLSPWLREHESCMLYADTGVGKSMFALSAALAVAGGGEFLGWKPDQRADGAPWKVLYVDGEMHIGDIQERARLLLSAVPNIDRDRARANLRFVARQHQDPGEIFPSITEEAGSQFILQRVKNGPLDLVVLDNFSTLGEVEDENAASSFNRLQAFLLQLKTQGVATILVHHSGKPQGSKVPVSFRGSSKLAATFETIIQLERFQKAFETEEIGAQFAVRWDKVRAGGPTRQVRMVAARLVSEAAGFGEPDHARWEYVSAEAPRLLDIKEQLQKLAFRTQAEMAEYYGVSATQIANDRDKGIELGLWTVEWWARKLRHGKAQRTRGATSSPVGDLAQRDGNAEPTYATGPDGAIEF
jgi:AAA domain